MTTATAEFEPDIVERLEPVLCDGEMLLAYPAGRHAEFQTRPAKVTVIVPVYNGEARLLRCLESIAEQTLPDYRVIVVDNCSTDQSLALACGFAAENPKFLVYQNPMNVGRVGNWNRGLELACGQYLKPLMVNDYLLPDCLAELSSVLDANPNVVIARASLTALDQGIQHFIPLFDSTRCVTGQEAIEYGITIHNAAAGPSAQMFRRNVVADHKISFDTGNAWAADYEFAMRLYEWGDLYYVRKSLFVFENTARFATQTKLWQELHDWIEVIGGSVARYQTRLGPEVLSRARAKVQSLHREYVNKCTSLEDGQRCDQILQDARSRHPLLFSQSAGIQSGPVITGAGPEVAEAQLRKLARQVGDEQKQSPYYEQAEKQMDTQWQTTIWPFIKNADFSNVLDLAAGHGRNSEKLKGLARKIYVVDINQENIDFCQKRFAGDARFTFIRNDGFSLSAIPSGELTLVYCFEAMVHFDSDVVRAYLREFQRVLRSGGLGFCHHSNYTGNPGGDVRDNPGWRNFMSQALFAHLCAKEGLKVLKSTVIDWDGPGSDCLTLFGKP